MQLFKPVSLEKVPTLVSIMMFFWWSLFIIPVIMLFYQYKGLTIGDFFLIQGLFRVFIFFVEIPTGYLGDLFSRKKIISLSVFLFLVGNIIWFSFSGFTFILLGELIFAFSSALYSGTGEAYIYDILKKQGKEQTMNKVWGQIRSSMILGTTIATFTGGIIYQHLGPSALVIIETSFMFFAFILSLFLPEFNEHKRVVQEGKNKWKDILEISKYASTHPEIKWLMTFPAVFGAGTLMLMWSQQPIMESKLIPIALFGVFMGTNQMFRAILSNISHHLFTKLKTNKYSLFVFSIFTLGLISLITATFFSNKIFIYVLLVFIALAAASQASLKIVMSSMINHRIKSDERATILSVSSMFDSVCSATIMIIMKFLFDGFGLQMTFIILGPIVLLLTFISMIKLLKLKI